MTTTSNLRAGASSHAPETPSCDETPSRDSSTPSRRERTLTTTLRSTLPAFGLLCLFALLALLDPGALAAQQGPGSGLASQSMRPYAHVFWAYALGWALILGWVVSLSRRWSRVEDDLERSAGRE